MLPSTFNVAWDTILSSCFVQNPGSVASYGDEIYESLVKQRLYNLHFAFDLCRSYCKACDFLVVFEDNQQSKP